MILDRWLRPTRTCLIMVTEWAVWLIICIGGPAVPSVCASPTGVSRDVYNNIGHIHGIWSHFLLPWQRRSASWSESLKRPWVVYRFICIHLHGWIQSRIRPQINSCIIMIKSCTVYRLLFITAFIQRPLYITKREKTADTHQDPRTADDMCMLNGTQSCLCIVFLSISLCSDVSDLSLSPPSPRCPASLHCSGGHVRLYKPPTGLCSAWCLNRVRSSERLAEGREGIIACLSGYISKFRQLSFNGLHWPFILRLNYKLHILHLSRPQHCLIQPWNKVTIRLSQG